MTNTPKTPGKIVGDAGQKILELYKLLETNFQEYYKVYKEEELNIKESEKEFISLYLELILRDNNKYMNYDIFPLNYYVQ